VGQIRVSKSLGRSAHQAVEAAQQYIAEGCRWVVDLDLEKFFGAPG
jgi:retron-type reverse transcriptase